MLWDVDMWREMERIRREMDGLFTNFGRASGATTYPLVNVYDDKESVVVTAELPGVPKDQVNITYSDGALTIAGKHKPLADVKGMTVVRAERAVGDFQKSIRLPTKVNADRIHASFGNGILTVKLPKAEEVKPRTIAIEAK